MAKGKAKQLKRKIRGDEFAERINYLAQISEKVANKYPSLAKYYGKVLTTISEKTPAKLDYTLKRSKCKKCHSPLLVPGANMRYRLKRRKGRKGRPVQVITCLDCGTIKRFPTNPKHQLRAETDGEILTDEVTA